MKKETRNSLPATSCCSVSCLQQKYNFKHETDLPGQCGARQSTKHYLFCSHSEHDHPGQQCSSLQEARGTLTSLGGVSQQREGGERELASSSGGAMNPCCKPEPKQGTVLFLLLPSTRFNNALSAQALAPRVVESAGCWNASQGTTAPGPSALLHWCGSGVSWELSRLQEWGSVGTSSPQAGHLRGHSLARHTHGSQGFFQGAAFAGLDTGVVRRRLLRTLARVLLPVRLLGRGHGRDLLLVLLLQCPLEAQLEDGVGGSDGSWNPGERGKDGRGVFRQD